MALPTLDSPLYDTTLPVSKKKVIFRPFLVKEEKILILADGGGLDGVERAVRQVVDNCTMNEIDTDDLCKCDLEWILLQLRGQSKGFTSDLVFRCTSKNKDGKVCGFKNDITVDVNKVTVDDEITENTVHISDTIGLKMKLPSIKIMKLIESLDEKPIDALLSRIMSSIDTIYNEDQVWKAESLSREELIDFIESFSHDQFEKVKDWIDHEPSLALEVDYLCQKCGATDKITITGLDSFFG